MPSWHTMFDARQKTSMASEKSQCCKHWGTKYIYDYMMLTLRLKCQQAVWSPRKAPGCSSTGSRSLRPARASVFSPTCDPALNFKSLEILYMGGCQNYGPFWGP